MPNNKKLKIAIVWANPYNKNLGVGALAYSSLALIHDVLKENSISGEITFVGSYKSGKDSVVIGGEKMEFDNIIGLDYLNWKSWAKIILKPGKFNITKLISFDYIFDIAEGDSFADIYGDRRFYRIFNSKKLFNYLGKKQILMPQTIGPFKNPEKEKMAIGIMNKLEMVLSRDRKSFDYTKGFLPENKIAELIDVAFYMPFDRQRLNNGKINVGINVSGLLWNGGYTGNNQFNMKTDYKKLITDTIEYFNTLTDVQLHIVSHVIPEHSPVEDDSKVAKELKKIYPNIVLSPIFETPIEAKSYISGMDFFTGARMHACIAAYSSEVAVYPMAYSRKFNGLFVDTLTYSHMGDCVNNTETEVLAGLKQAFEDRKFLKDEISRTINEIVKPRLTMLKGILTQTLKN